MCTNIRRTLHFFSSLLLNEGTPRVPEGRESNSKATKWKAGALTIELRLTPIELRLTNICDRAEVSQRCLL